MRHALYLPPFGPLADPGALVELARAAEDRGWAGMFLWDHVLRPAPEPPELADATVCLAAMAVATTRLRLGPMVVPLVRRRPQKVAREIATLDLLSGGRITLGLGLGVDSGGELTRFGELHRGAGPRRSPGRGRRPGGRVAGGGAVVAPRPVLHGRGRPLRAGPGAAAPPADLAGGAPGRPATDAAGGALRGDLPHRDRPRSAGPLRRDHRRRAGRSRRVRHRRARRGRVRRRRLVASGAPRGRCGTSRRVRPWPTCWPASSARRSDPF